jgi:hypothetical protein
MPLFAFGGAPLLLIETIDIERATNLKMDHGRGDIGRNVNNNL